MNKIIELLRDGFQGKLVVGSTTSSVIPAGESLDLEVNIGVNKMLLKSLEVTCNKNTDFRVEFFEEPARSNSRYNSGIVNTEAYDVMDLPYMDKATSNQMYFRITNTSTFDTTYDIEIRGIELK